MFATEAEILNRLFDTRGHHNLRQKIKENNILRGLSERNTGATTGEAQGSS
jgi:hypothetical protein